MIGLQGKEVRLQLFKGPTEVKYIYICRLRTAAFLVHGFFLMYECGAKMERIAPGLFVKGKNAVDCGLKRKHHAHLKRVKLSKI